MNSLIYIILIIIFYMKNLIYILILLGGFPLGFLLSKICKDEIKNWRKRLFILSISSLLISVLVSFTNFYFKFPIILGLLLMIIICLTIIYKSY
jgi:hypothetical protein